MFTVEEKRKIAKAIEDILLELNHPEMPKEKPEFQLTVDGKSEWSWAIIHPNWQVDEHQARLLANPWNEVAREELSKKDKQ